MLIQASGEAWLTRIVTVHPFSIVVPEYRSANGLARVSQTETDEYEYSFLTETRTRVRCTARLVKDGRPVPAQEFIE